MHFGRIKEHVDIFKRKYGYPNSIDRTETGANPGLFDGSAVKPDVCCQKTAVKKCSTALRGCVTRRAENTEIAGSSVN